MRTRVRLTDSETGKRNIVVQHPPFTSMTDYPSTCARFSTRWCRNCHVLASRTFRVLRETFNAIALVTDPEKVRETLSLFEGGQTYRK